MFDNLATKGQDEDINEVIKTEKTVQICNIAVAYMAATTVGDFGWAVVWKRLLQRLPMTM